MEKEHASDMACCCFFKHQTFWITIIPCTDVAIAIIKYSCVWKSVLCVFITSYKLTTKNKNVKTSRKINNIEKNEISITYSIKRNVYLIVMAINLIWCTVYMIF